MSTPWTHILKKVDDYRWEIPTSYKPGMRVPGLVFADERMLRQIVEEQALEQVANVAILRGRGQYSLAMADIHWGYGFPVGGFAGFDLDEGIISPGSIGFDINCGVRLIRTDLREEQVREKLQSIVDRLFAAVPSGIGSTRRIKVDMGHIDDVLSGGAKWAVKHGYGWPDDLEMIEAGGALEEADPDAVSQAADHRGGGQIVTLGFVDNLLGVPAVDQWHDRAPE